MVFKTFLPRSPRNRLQIAARLFVFRSLIIGNRADKFRAVSVHRQLHHVCILCRRRKLPARQCHRCGGESILHDQQRYGRHLRCLQRGGRSEWRLRLGGSCRRLREAEALGYASAKCLAVLAVADPRRRVIASFYIRGIPSSLACSALVVFDCMTHKLRHRLHVAGEMTELDANG